MSQTMICVARSAVAAAILSTVSFGATANDIGFGVGVSYVFGQGPAIGIKAFSDDEENKAAATLGLDYVFASGSFRPNVGIGYQGEGYFGDANLGYSLKTRNFDFATGAGWSDADSKSNDNSTTPTLPDNGNGQLPPPQQGQG
ncbi:hypothetical protein EF096_10490 [Pseudomonas neustonica]|uniref:Porin family protein n=1 Tax=Pseudomonas neustonica TaxID=2487346 RepID=A0ABX9XKC4_9PSED|nr:MULTISPECIES: hypothetical protein [Pseudomonas]ROZ84170.1 hypothetical protein EF099_07585 [Pseudomonas sp. SSM44]ROZ84417.1 hypothetical protein EF096_10490 [Pseudomonas neustonica]